MKLRHFALVLVATVFPAGCQKTFTGSLDWSGTIHTILIAGTLANAEGAATIQSVRLSLDGQEQTISPTNYSLSGVRVSLVDASLGGSTTLATTTLSDTSERLASGGQISYQFDL